MRDLTEASILRVLRSLLAQELAQGHGRRPDAAAAAAWPDDLSLGADGLGLDSLELLGCGAAVNGFFRLHESGVEDYLLAERSLDRWARIIRAGLADGTTGLTFATSGSSGAPKPCFHPHASLLQEAGHWAGVFADRGRVIQCVPAHHIYGFLFTVLLPQRLGIPVVDARGRAAGPRRRLLRPDDLVVGFPAGWPALLAGVEALPPGIRLASSTAPLPAAMHRALRAAGAAEVTEIYGSSETAGIASRCHPDSPFTLLPHWQPGASGEHASLRDSLTGEETPLPDHATWTEAGRLRLLGRKDQAVQVGGINVFPEQVAARLGRHALVRACAVRLDAALPVPRLKAFVVLREGAQPGAAAELDRWCRQEFSAAERPVRLDIGASLPVGVLGKAADWSIPAA